MIGELGTTSDPEVLVPGSPRTVRLDADDLEARAREMAEAAERIRARTVEGWSGATAEGWVAHQAGLSTTCDAVADVYLAVGAALRRHGDVLAEARRDAQDAVDLWNGRRGIGEVPQCLGATAWSPSGGSGWLTGSPATPEQRAEAELLLAAARAEVRSSGAELAALLRELSAGLPDGRWHTGQFFQGVLDWALGIVTLAWSLSPLRTVVDTEGARADNAEMAAGAIATWQRFEDDPYSTMALLADAQTLQDDPALWWGRAAPDLALAVAPGAVSSGSALLSRSSATAARATSVNLVTDVGAAGVALGTGDDVAAALEAAARARATLSTGARDLRWRLASESQLAEAGTVIAGPGSARVLRDAPRLAAQYGGEPGDWVKKTSESYAADGRRFEIHWYENLATGTRFEPKTKIQQWENR